MKESLTYLGLAVIVWFAGVGALETYNKLRVGAVTRPFLQEVIVDPNSGIGTMMVEAPPPGRRR